MSALLLDLCEEDQSKEVMADVYVELRRSTEIHGGFRSQHEAYAILKEEVDELWDGIRHQDCNSRIRKEAIQIAAMAIRFVMDFT